ncbi:MAG: hypothetical protein H0X13_19895 [Ramlibacter sp.]|nr:hypothetical protein [Ramlibacter sp.]
MSKRFILIESNSGYVWGEAQAADIVSACRAVDRDISAEPREYEELGHDPRDTSGYYVVYDATDADLVASDGQNREVIAAVSALPVAGYVRSSAVIDGGY